MIRRWAVVGWRENGACGRKPTAGAGRRRKAVAAQATSGLDRERKHEKQLPASWKLRSTRFQHIRPLFRELVKDSPLLLVAVPRDP